MSHIVTLLTLRYWIITGLDVKRLVIFLVMKLMRYKKYKSDKKKLLGLVNSKRFEDVLARSRHLCRRYPDAVEIRVYAALAALNLPLQLEFESIYQKLMAMEGGNTSDFLRLGEALLHKGNNEPGIQCIKRALFLDENNVPALTLLASQYLSLGQFDMAETCYLKLAHLEGEKSKAWFFLGAINGVQEKYNEAIEYTERAISADMRNVDAYFNLAGAYKHLGYVEKAIASYTKVTELSPNHFEAHGNLGVLFKNLGEKKKARQHLEEALRIQPDKEAMKYQLASLTGEAIPAESIAHLFDEEAEIFEDLLVDKLEYVTPRLLLKAVESAIAGDKVFENVLDIGCGTGLCGPLFRDMCGQLVGVDLSREMIRKAKEKDIYDDLYVEELVAFLRDGDSAFDLMIAADVFNYVGDLVSVFSACKGRLSLEGVIVFSTEINESESVQMDDRTLRYSHSHDYVERTISDAGLELLHVDTGVQRKERGAPVYGNIFVCRNTLQVPPCLKT